MKDKWYVWTGKCLIGPETSKEAATRIATEMVQLAKCTEAIVLHSVAVLRPQVMIDALAE